ncbi:hypothetical protein EUX98_g6554 [Antrodiella citrinella]|uniref:RNA helicase n=1 Tax=Antrodiella citrinella TaxID=2447956 RepID=A0A4S4MR93_9APHY|nr:hypothetical protein EUX98_g6554 [Antrodiella citrinella]
MQFWKPGTVAPGSSLDRVNETDGSVVSSAPLSSLVSVQSARERLPIYRHREKLLYCVEKYGVVIVVGQTGCGKTTQLPQYLHEAGWAADGNVIACTQPRRVAATSVAGRVATEVGSILGDEVGYTIRFEDVSDKERTRILYLTDGILFRETLRDPLLSRYSVIMIDEAHERTIYTDLLLGILKKRVSSIYGLHIADVALQGPGDVLIFLTGREEIERCLEDLAELLPTLPPSSPRLKVLALHAGLSIEEQLAAFEPAERGTRKVIVSTNIAEASVTIEGIKYVVDSGFVKLKSLGIDDVMKFEWVTAPPAQSILRALEGLVAAGMVGEDGKLTVSGEKLFSSKDYQCGEEILTIVCMTTVQDIFIIPDGAAGAMAELERRKFTAEEGDHLTLLNVTEVEADCML